MRKNNAVFTVAITLLLTLLLGFSTLDTDAQCSSITGVSTSVTHAACPSTGKIVVNSSAAGVAGTTYKIISGPAGYPTNEFSSNIIPSLLAGTYQIQITCGEATAIANATINNNYTALTVTATATSCTSFSAGGNIAISATGSASPFRYAVVQSNDPTVVIPDAAYTVLSGTVNYGVANYGQYQVKVKDTCGNIVTKSVEVLKTSPPAIYENSVEYYTCANTIVRFVLKDATNGNIINKINSGYKLEIWAGATSCPATTGTPTFEDIVDANYFLEVPKNTSKIAYRITSPCGEVTTGCRDVDPFVFTATPKVNTDCSGNITGFSVTQNGSPNYTLSYTVTMRLTFPCWEPVVHLCLRGLRRFIYQHP